jgi:eukaryotic-like serine/threonine-protein kinase
MDSERWRQVAHVYESALEREGHERDAFLTQASVGDEELRREVESLLAHDSTPVLIDRPMLEAAADLLNDPQELMRGAMLGPYRIDGLLGAGGMGRVYRAIDTRLDRTVAVKVLPAALATDPQFRARFDREAHAIAALTHPHICTLHDVGHQDDIDFLVMEYLEGDSLAVRLASGPLPPDQALRYSIEIAGALAAAHRQGIVHRDLKPGNIVLTRGGAKLVDFGLAKPMASLVASRGPTSTMPASVTAQGTIVGTLQYMAPEQLEGKDPDARTDIFAFGAVVYEMLTGRKAFEGKSQASLIGAIMHAEPAAIATVQPLTPPTLDRIVKTCLAKDPDDRWQTARDLSRELQWIGRDTIPTATPQRSPVRRTLLVAGAPAALAALTGYAAWTLKPAAAPSEAVTRFSFTLPDDLHFTRTTRHVIAMSPDGAHIALVANALLYLRSMADEELRPVVGTGQDVSSPFFSPDGRWVAFWTSSGAGSINGTLWKIAVTGGAPVMICKTRIPFGASWGADNQILIGMGQNGIHRVSAEGGNPETIIRVGPQDLASTPQMLEDGESVLFTIGKQGKEEVDPVRQRDWDRAQIVVESLKSGDRKVLFEGGSDARYLRTGHIVYAFASTLWGRVFDLKKLEVGNPESLVEGVRRRGIGGPSIGAAQFTFSSNGSMAYVTGNATNASSSRSLALVDWNGGVKPLELPPGQYHSPRFSPDGKQIALYMSDGHIWVHHLSGTKSFRKLTLEGANQLPVWTRDRRIVFRSVAPAGLFWQRADGGTPAEPLTEPGARSYLPYSVSPDGKTLFMRANNDGGHAGQELAALSLYGDRTPKPLPQGPSGGILFGPSLSPDGRWLAYELRNAKSGVNIYVDPFPTTGARCPVTTDGGGMNPMWSPDGRLIYVQTQPPWMGEGSSTFYSVEVLGTGSGCNFSKAQQLFSVDRLFISDSGQGNLVDLSPDGKQFVTLVLPPAPDGESGQEQVNVVLNWFADLKQRVQAK